VALIEQIVDKEGRRHTPPYPEWLVVGFNWYLKSKGFPARMDSSGEIIPASGSRKQKSGDSILKKLEASSPGDPRQDQFKVKVKKRA